MLPLMSIVCLLMNINLKNSDHGGDRRGTCVDHELCLWLTIVKGIELRELSLEYKAELRMASFRRPSSRGWY